MVRHSKGIDMVLSEITVLRVTNPASTSSFQLDPCTNPDQISRNAGKTVGVRIWCKDILYARELLNEWGKECT